MYAGCTCIYLPIKGTHVDRVQECYEKLSLDISRFQSKGRIKLLGGYNECVSKDLDSDNTVFPLVFFTVIWKVLTVIVEGDGLGWLI